MTELFSKRNFAKIFVPTLACLLTFTFFVPHLTSGKIPIPADDLVGLYHPWRDISLDGYSPERFPAKNPLITDPILETYPWRKTVINNFKNHMLPLWNPYNFSGQPLLANIQSSPFSLLNLTYFILPFNIAWGTNIIVQTILTTLFTYLFLRSLKLSKIASLYAGIVLPFTGFFIAWLTWGTVITTAMWLPLILLSINKITTSESFFWPVILTFSMSQTIFSGHWQTALYVYLAAFIYLSTLFATSKNIKSFIVYLASIATALLIAAPQILPSIEFIKLSARDTDQGYYQGRKDWFLPPQNLIQILAPDFFGNPTTFNYWGIWNYGEFVSFIGLVPLSLALLALLNRQKGTGFLIVTATISLILSIQNPLSKLPYVFKIPLISSLQPSRIIFLIDFSLVCLAAFGLDIIIRNRSKKIFIPALTILVILLGTLLITYILKDSFPITNSIDSLRVARRNLVLPILFACFFLVIVILRAVNLKKIIVLTLIFVATVVELFRFGYKFTPFSKLSWIFPPTKTTDYLKSQPKPFRVMTTDRRIFSSAAPSVSGIESVHGYDPLFLADYAKLVSAWQSGKVVTPGSFNRIVTPDKFDNNLLNFLNVRYLLTFDDIKNPDFIKVFEEGNTKVFENNKALPRAFFANEIIKTSNRDQTLEKLIENKDFRTSFSEDAAFEKSNVNGFVDVKKYTDQSLLLETTSNVAAPLIISNVFYPGWRAYVDNAKTNVERVNFMFQMIMIPKGHHLVSLNYQPVTFKIGSYLSASGIAIMFLFYLWHRKFR